MALTAADAKVIWDYKPSGQTYTTYQFLHNASDAKDALGGISKQITALNTLVVAGAKSTDLAAARTALADIAKVTTAMSAQLAKIQTALTAESDTAVPSDVIHKIVQDAVAAGVSQALAAQA